MWSGTGYGSGALSRDAGGRKRPAAIVVVKAQDMGGSDVAVVMGPGPETLAGEEKETNKR
jgi:hypothetical protein